MLNGNRLYQLAVGGCLAAVLILAHADQVAAQQETAKPQGAAAQQEAAPKPATKTAPKDNEATTENPKSPDDDSEYRSKEDLKAQRRMAEAAEKQLGLIDFQNWVTIAEASLLAISIFFTAWAAIAASSAAAAADRAVEVTSNTAERQLRAYIAIDDVNRISRKDETGVIHWEADARLRNYGQTPAYNVSIAIKTAVLKKPQMPDWETLEFHPDIYLPPGHYVDAGFQVDEIRHNWQSFKDDQIVIYIWGRAEYTDAFKKARWFTFRMENIYSLGKSFRYCHEGNDAN